MIGLSCIQAGQLCLKTGSSHLHCVVSSRAMTAPGTWGAYRGAPLPRIHFAEGGQCLVLPRPHDVHDFRPDMHCRSCNGCCCSVHSASSHSSTALANSSCGAHTDNNSLAIPFYDNISVEGEEHVSATREAAADSKLDAIYKGPIRDLWKS
jgi:hypothetical protein